MNSAAIVQEIPDGIGAGILSTGAWCWPRDSSGWSRVERAPDGLVRPLRFVCLGVAGFGRRWARRAVFGIRGPASDGRAAGESAFGPCRPILEAENRLCDRDQTTHHALAPTDRPLRIRAGLRGVPAQGQAGVQQRRGPETTDGLTASTRDSQRSAGHRDSRAPDEALSSVRSINTARRRQNASAPRQKSPE